MTTSTPPTTTTHPPADGPWLLSRAINDLPFHGFDLDDLPDPYPRLIALALATPKEQRLAAINAELIKLPPAALSDIAGAINNAKPVQPRSAALVRSRTAADLLHAALPPHRWLIEGLLIRPGLTLLGGQPKVGKSWLGLQLARAVALGTTVLQRAAAQPGLVLYYALEDGPSRLQTRLRTAGWDGSENVRFLCGDAIPPLDSGGLAALGSDIQRRQPALVVIDSLAAAKSSNLAENDSGQVAELMYTLARLCSAHDLSILVIHHHRKVTTGSPLADLRGSGALGGAADAILALYRERNALESRLGLDSRDTVGGDWTLEFTGSAWHLVGDAALLDYAKDQRAIARAIATFGPAGASLDDIIDVVGMRRQDTLMALKALVQAGQITAEELSARDHAGRPRKIYHAAEFNSVPDLHNETGT